MHIQNVCAINIIYIYIYTYKMKTDTPKKKTLHSYWNQYKTYEGDLLGSSTPPVIINNQFFILSHVAVGRSDPQLRPTEY